MTFAADPSFRAGGLVPRKPEEPAWSPALRVACSTVARDPDVSTVSVVVTLTGSLADASGLVAFSQALASEHGLHAELQSFAPPTFTVRFSRNGTEASTFEGGES